MKNIAAITTTATILAALAAAPGHAATLSQLNDSVAKFSPDDDEAAIQNSGAASVTFGNTTLYIGTYQASGNNQDPIIASFTNGEQDWIRADYETTGTDARGEGLLWDGAGNLYAAFTTTGTQGTPDEDFRRFTTDGWLNSYGPGGGAKASVLLKLNPDTGAGIPGAGTFIRARLSNGNTNTVVPTGLDFAGDRVVFFGDSFFSPLDTDGSRLEQTDTSLDSPFDYRLVFDDSLTTALSAEAIGWDGVTEFSDLAADPGDGDGDMPDDGSGDGDVPDDGSDDGDVPDDGSDDGDVPDDGSGDGDMPGDGGDMPGDGDVPRDDDTPDSDEPDNNPQSVPEPGSLLGLSAIAGVAALSRRWGQKR